MKTELFDEAIGYLRADEGVKRFAYDDATGREVSAPEGTLTIGVGINLKVGLDDYEIDMLTRHRLHSELLTLEHAASTREPAVELVSLPGPVQVALALMAYQLGADRLMEFHRMLDAVAAGDWQRAANEAVHSRWDRQTPRRAERVASLLRGLAARDKEAGPELGKHTASYLWKRKLDRMRAEGYDV